MCVVPKHRSHALAHQPKEPANSSQRAATISPVTVALSCLLVSPLGCVSQGGHEVALAKSPETPAARGSVSIHEGKNNNEKIFVRVEHLALPADVKPDATAYVVWIDPEGAAPPQNVGQMQVDSSLSGRLVTVTPVHHFDVFITPESSPMATAPTGPHVLAANVP